MNNTVDKDQTLAFSFINILFRRGWSIVLCLLAVLVPITIYNRTATPVYEAITTIIYEDPLVPVTPTTSYHYEGKESLLNHIQEIKSRSVSYEVVKGLPDNVLKSIPLPLETGDNFNFLAYYAAVIRGNIHAEPVGESDVIQIKVNACDAFASMNIANTISDVLVKRNLRIRKDEVSSARAFIEEQRGKYAAKLKNVETKLRLYKEKNKVTSLDREIEEVLKRITHIDALYQETKANLDKTQKRLHSITNKISSRQQKLVPTISDVSTPLVQELKEDLKDLRSSYIRMTLQGVPDSNTKMIKMRDEMARIRVELTKEAVKIVEADEMIDPLSQIESLFEEKFNLELELETLRTQEGSLAAGMRNYETTLRQLPIKEYELARLTRERDLANSIFVMLSKRSEEARITEAEKAGTLRVIDMAGLPNTPIRPKKKLNLILGLVFGLTVGIGLAVFLETMDTSIKTPEEVEKKTGLRLLGSIPHVRGQSQISRSFDPEEPRHYRHPAPQLVTFNNPSSPASEAYKALRTNLQLAHPSKNIRTIMLTSSGPREGKSTTLANLAVATSQIGLKTLVIDADLRKPTIHHLFGLCREPGLATILSSYTPKEPTMVVSPGRASSGFKELDELLPGYISPLEVEEKNGKTAPGVTSLELAISEAIQTTKIKELDVLTCGKLPANPSELLAGQTIAELLKLLKTQYEFVLIDTPPIIAVTDAAVLGPHVDAVAIVIESGRNDKEIIQKAKSLVDLVEVNVLGAILNNVREKNLYGDYNYYYTYYSDNLQKPSRKKQGSKIVKTR